MRFADLDTKDRRISMGAAAISLFLFWGLVISGAWNVLIDAPQRDDIRLVRGDMPVLPTSLTATDIHASFADVSAAFTLLVVAWVSYRVLFRVSRVGVAVLVIVAMTILGGAKLETNALRLRPGARPAGRGDTSFEQYDILRFPDAIWGALHLASAPLLVLLVWFALRSTGSPNGGPEDPTWLDRLRT